MANRSYLYTCDRAPGPTKPKSKSKFTARGLSEQAHVVPLVHKLMMAGEPEIVRSAIWEADVAILADRAGAFERVIALFDRIGAGTVPKRKQFDQRVADMKAFLAGTPKSKYVLLEATEIFELEGDDPEDAVDELLEEIEGVEASCASAKWLAKARTKWSEVADPGDWSEHLYFSL